MFMVFGYIAINVLTYNEDRNSSTYKLKLTVFLIYEGIFYVLFVLNYIKGMYLAYSPEFERKAIIIKKEDPAGTNIAVPQSKLDPS